jgi:hypothetical protein
MYNSMIPEVMTGVVTSVGIILFVAFNVIHFNNHLKDRMNAR